MKQQAKLLDAQTQAILIETLEIANTPWARFRGLMLRRSVPPSYGLLIQSCRSIHTMWMRMPIDVYFLSPDNVVLGIRDHVRPWRVAFAPKGTISVLEIQSGQTKISIGTKLVITPIVSRKALAAGIPPVR